MNVNTAKICSAFLVLNALFFTRAGFNYLHLRPEMLAQLSPNGLFHLIPIPTTVVLFQVAVVIYFLAALVFLFSFNRYALLVFFIAGSIVDNVHVNFSGGGHSRYLEYSLILHGVIALFVRADGKSYLNSYRALVAAYYFVAGIYKFAAAGLLWSLDEAIFVHAVAVQVTTPVKELVLQRAPDFFRFGAYIVFIAELLSPLILFFRPARWAIIIVLFGFHFLFPVVWGGHRDFVTNCIGLLLCLGDEKWFQFLFQKYESWLGMLKGRIKAS